MNFEEAYKILGPAEGGFQNDPDDSGNWTRGVAGSGENKGTNGGISAASYPNLDIKNLTPEQIKAIYLADYWNEIRADELPDKTKLGLFDVAVMSGTKTAVRMLQKAISRPQVIQDGIIGPKTISWAHKLNLTQWDIARQRSNIYVGAIKQSPVKIKYLGGWIERVLNCAEKA